MDAVINKTDAMRKKLCCDIQNVALINKMYAVIKM